MSGQHDSSQRVSDGTALALTAAVTAVLMLNSRILVQMFAAKPAVPDRGMELTLQEAPVETPPAPPPPLPRPPVSHAVARAQPQPREPLPVIEEPAPANADLIAADPAPSAPTANGPSRADLEAQYAAALRADIDSRTRPPDSAQYRVHHPSGEVRVRFVVLRSGEPQAVAVLRSSGSPLLDEAAVGIVASGRYPPMPPKCFVGEAQHTFVVTIEFRRPGQTWNPQRTQGSVA
jgi:periplasmic protein TonB